MADRTETGTQRRLLDGSLLLIALGALALAVSLFLDWYGEAFDGGGITAWTAFELVDIVIAGLALAALAAVAERLLDPAAAPRLPAWVSVVCGPVALVLVAVSLIDQSPVANAVGATVAEGGWIALAGAGLMTIGVLLTRLRISIVVGAREQAAPVDRAAETRPLRTEAADPPDPDRPTGAR